MLINNREEHLKLLECTWRELEKRLGRPLTDLEKLIANISWNKGYIRGYEDGN